MTFAQMIKTIQNRCNNNSLLTKSYIESLARPVMLDLGLKAGVFFETETITLVIGTRTYQFTKNSIMSINKIELGTTQQFTDNEQVVLDPGTDYTISWQTNSVSGSVNVVTVNLNFDPETSQLIKINCNDIAGAAATIDFSDTAVVPKDSQFSPILDSAIMDGIIAMFKFEIERNPFGSAAVQKSVDTMQETNAIYKERVEYP